MREVFTQVMESLALLGAGIGGFFVVMALVTEAGAPAQGALAAIGVGFAVVPYCIATIAHRVHTRDLAREQAKKLDATAPR